MASNNLLFVKTSPSPVQTKPPTAPYTESDPGLSETMCEGGIDWTYTGEYAFMGAFLIIFA